MRRRRGPEPNPRHPSPVPWHRSFPRHRRSLSLFLVGGSPRSGGGWLHRGCGPRKPLLCRAMVSLHHERVLVQWARDSAYRFFPLKEDPQLGLTLHPLDLATNKALALVGRLEPLDWVDMPECHSRLQPLGFLLWAACGKDPGYTPDFLITLATRQRYAQAELDLLAFDGPAPDAAALSLRWKPANSLPPCLPKRLGAVCSPQAEPRSWAPWTNYAPPSRKTASCSTPAKSAASGPPSSTNSLLHLECGGMTPLLGRDMSRPSPRCPPFPPTIRPTF